MEQKENEITTVYASNNPDIPTLTEAATLILAPEEMVKLRRNMTAEKVAHARYLREHPEIDAIMRYAMRKLIMERSEDPVNVLLEFFSTADLRAALAEENPEAEGRAAMLREKRGLTIVLPS
ncbi:hypothetical protein, conserved [Trypanosoma brucei gambiense DAL972]|uniref:RIIa domain-containing protein n=1 Tax=Trypanosoma brucei gambiense (strain MHOM/CI/86/DAL972) TaxID=679716 RepID=D0A1V5_TRYB9|nr:hypothetical protein, conserved [Trypanosoma brucei gambiense DAL972]CBH15248.1 hypothetical protein, conserved [Trypanosoma brucei gambiense DAL972]|eukprot:XP_011777513.1 hypothetical protein, conserved [Trypanosoma brucei gambiense DAL972]